MPIVYRVQHKKTQIGPFNHNGGQDLAQVRGIKLGDAGYYFTGDSSHPTPAMDRIPWKYYGNSGQGLYLVGIPSKKKILHWFTKEDLKELQ